MVEEPLIVALVKPSYVEKCACVETVEDMHVSRTNNFDTSRMTQRRYGSQSFGLGEKISHWHCFANIHALHSLELIVVYVRYVSRLNVLFAIGTCSISQSLSSTD